MKSERGKSLTDSRLLWNVVYILFFAGVLALLIRRCRYGFGNWDESFYLTIPYRLLQGDALFADEWHLSQMSSVLLLPFVYAYTAIFKTTTGMLLAFRYIYIAVQALVSIFIYVKLKKYSVFGAAVSSLSFFLYAPFSINAMSYNSLGIICLTVSCVLLCTGEKEHKIGYFFSGIFYAAAVLCCPYLAALLPLIVIASLISEAVLSKNGAGGITEAFAFKNVLWLILGIAFLAVVFLAFVLSRASVSSIIDALPGIFDDPEHKSLGFGKKFLNYLICIYEQQKETSRALYILMDALMLVALIDRKRKERRIVYLIAFSAITIVLAFVLASGDYINLVIFPLNILALSCFVLFYDDSTIRRLFVSLWIPGMIYSFCLQLSSNQVFYAVSSASAVALVGSLVIIMLAFETAFEEESTVSFRIVILLFATGLFAWQLCNEAYYRYSQVYWEDGISGHDYMIEEGFEKGVYVTESKYNKYNNALKMKSEVTAKYSDKDSILFLSEETWLYLVYEEYENPAYSAWLSGVNDSTVERLKTYYSLREEKIPDLIYVESKNMEYGERLAAYMGYTKDILSNGDAVFVRK